LIYRWEANKVDEVASLLPLPNCDEWAALRLVELSKGKNMPRSLMVLSVVFLAAFSTVSLQAACGGGGYTVVKSSKPTGVNAAPQQQQQQQVNYTRVVSAPSSGVVHESARPSSEYREVSRASRETSEKIEKLQREVDKTQAKLDRCSGECDKERRKLAEAKAKLAGYQNQPQRN